jgi:hypothetical protein
VEQHNPNEIKTFPVSIDNKRINSLLFFFPLYEQAPLNELDTDKTRLNFGQKFAKFPLFFPVSREFSGEKFRQTASSARFSILARPAIRAGQATLSRHGSTGANPTTAQGRTNAASSQH